MKSLILLVVGLLSVGCGKTEPMGSGNEYNAELAIDQNTTKAEPVKELTPEQKQQKALRDSVVGEYKKDGDTYKFVFLENGVYESYINDKKGAESKWSIVDGEIHLSSDLNEGIFVYRIKADKSITQITYIRDGKREDLPKEHQTTFKKIK